MFLAECLALGKAWATPWSVMAMAGWPHRSARLTTFLSEPMTESVLKPTAVRASMADMLVCRCSSTRFSGAVSWRCSWGAVVMAMGSSTMSP